MFGKIVYISEVSATVEITGNSKSSDNLINMHVVFEDRDKKILGEVSDVS